MSNLRYFVVNCQISNQKYRRSLHCMSGQRNDVIVEILLNLITSWYLCEMVHRRHWYWQLNSIWNCPFVSGLHWKPLEFYNIESHHLTQWGKQHSWGMKHLKWQSEEIKKYWDLGASPAYDGPISCNYGLFVVDHGVRYYISYLQHIQLIGLSWRQKDIMSSIHFPLNFNNCCRIVAI